ncbi:MAG TPA: dihydropteroate synthase [Solirubrobacteraceae bacterium]|nr:dihydropteroate synthase [Solirubrobacteraceae bacterium]
MSGPEPGPDSVVPTAAAGLHSAVAAAGAGAAGLHSAVAAAAAGRFQVMGIVNVTPDSFSDGGLYLDHAAAVAHGLALEDEGATILDIGGESTRPGAQPVPAAEEMRRVIGVIAGLRERGCRAQLSIDTSKAQVAQAALAAGATLVNDVTALRGDPEMAAVVAASGADLCLMHMRGTPRTMQHDPRYDDVVRDVAAFLRERLDAAVAAGIAEERIALDPGIGFGKTGAHNLELLRRTGELTALGRPLVIGTSRKSFLGRITDRPVKDRIAATIATNLVAYERGARIFRVHDVAPIHDALQVAAATLTPAWRTTTPTTTTMPTT